jgi:hypothetical protein
VHPEAQIFLFGDETGSAEACREFGARHFPDIPSNEFGTPRLDYAFRETAKHAGTPWLCYVNADILLFADVVDAAQTLGKGCSKFLAVGRRWNFDAQDVEVGSCKNCPEKLKDQIRALGTLYNGYNIDYFLYPAGCFDEIPPFVVGRPAWDNWMIYDARRRQMPVIDATEAIFAGHQNHDYAHTQEGRSGGKAALWKGVEAQRNRTLAGYHLFSIDDTTHRLDGAAQLVPRRLLRQSIVRWRESPEVYPRYAWLLRPLRAIALKFLKTDRNVRLWLLEKGIDLFPNKGKRRPAVNRGQGNSE